MKIKEKIDEENQKYLSKIYKKYIFTNKIKYKTIKCVIKWNNKH